MTAALPVLDLPIKPLIPRPIDNTAMAIYMECPRKYRNSMVLHRRSDKPVAHLSYGSTWHKILECHYKGMTEDQVFDHALASWRPHNKPDDHRTFERCWLEYLKYKQKYGASPGDETAKTIGWPDRPMVEVNAEVGWDGCVHPYTVKIDRPIEFNGLYLAEDHKTSSRGGDSYWRQFENDHQMIGYCTILQELLGVEVHGFRINAHWIRKKDSDFKRKVMSVSQGLMKDWKQQYSGIWIKRLASDYETNEWPMNRKACAGKYGMCQYVGICSLEPEQQDTALIEDFPENPWNPLESDEFTEGGEEGE